MIRYTLLFTFITWLCLISYKDWYKGVCGLIFLMAFVERPDMPKQMFNIPGLNPWNMLFIVVLVASIVSLARTKRRVHLPLLIRNFLVFYLIFILIAFFREIVDLGGIIQYAELRGYEPISFKKIIFEDTFNTIKYAIPGILIFYGCNSKERFKLVIWALMLMNFLLALQIIKVMPIGALTDGYTLEKTAMRKIGRDLGYYRSDLAIFLGGAAWAIFCTKELVSTFWSRLVIYGASGLTIFAVALTGGRIGLGGCIVVGLVMAWYRWRRLLFLGPIMVLLIFIMIPSIGERFTQGFAENPYTSSHQIYKESDNSGETGLSSVTSGRTVIWPYVIKEIQKHPFLGQGRRSMQRSGLSSKILIEIRDSFPHPHNAYLQLFLDNGLVLGVPILLFYIILVKYALEMFKVNNNAICRTAGGIALAFLLSFLVGCIGQQSFYPVIGSVGLWCAIGILIRVRSDYMLGRPRKQTDNKTQRSWVQFENGH